MRFTDKIYKLADKFEYKLKVHAQIASADSTAVTLAVRPTVNNALVKSNLNVILSKIIQDAANKAAASDQEIHGDLKINDFITNATMTGGKWKIDPNASGLKVSGTLLNDKSAGPAVRQLISRMNASIIPVLQKEFDRMSSMDKESWSGGIIRNHETSINGVSLDV